MAVKLILREDVDKVGTRGELVSVKPGFARNYLLPKGLAMPVTPGAERLLAQEKKKYEKLQLSLKDDATKLKEQIEAVTVTLRKKAGEKGTLFGAVTPTDIAEGLLPHGIKLDKRRIDLHEAVKAIGDFTIPIRLHREVSATLKLTVMKEEE